MKDHIYEENDNSKQYKGENNTLENNSLKIVSGGNITFEGEYLMGTILENKTTSSN